MKGESIDSVLP